MQPSCVFISCVSSVPGAAGSSARTRVSSASSSAGGTPAGTAAVPRTECAEHAAKMAARSCGQLLPRAKRSVWASTCGHALDGRRRPASSAEMRRTSSGSNSSLMRRSSTAAMHIRGASGAQAPASSAATGRSPYKAASARGSSNASSGSTRSSSSGLRRSNTASLSTILEEGTACAASSACTRTRRCAADPPPEPIDVPSADATRTSVESPGAAAMAASSASMSGGQAAGATSAAHLRRTPTARSTAVSRPSGAPAPAAEVDAPAPASSLRAWSAACAEGCEAEHARNARSASAGSFRRKTAPTASAAAERVRASRSAHSWMSGGSTHSGVSFPSSLAAALRVGRSLSERHGTSFSTSASAYSCRKWRRAAGAASAPPATDPAPRDSASLMASSALRRTSTSAAPSLLKTARSAARPGWRAISSPWCYAEQLEDCMRAITRHTHHERHARA